MWRSKKASDLGGGGERSQGVPIPPPSLEEVPATVAAPAKTSRFSLGGLMSKVKAAGAIVGSGIKSVASVTATVGQSG